MATAAGYCRLSGGRSAGSRCRDEARRIKEGATGSCIQQWIIMVVERISIDAIQMMSYENEMVICFGNIWEYNLYCIQLGLRNKVLSCISLVMCIFPV